MRAKIPNLFYGQAIDDAASTLTSTLRGGGHRYNESQIDAAKFIISKTIEIESLIIEENKQKKLDILNENVLKLNNNLSLVHDSILERLMELNINLKKYTQESFVSSESPAQYLDSFLEKFISKKQAIEKIDHVLKKDIKANKQSKKPNKSKKQKSIRD